MQIQLSVLAPGRNQTQNLVQWEHSLIWWQIFAGLRKHIQFPPQSRDGPTKYLMRTTLSCHIPFWRGHKLSIDGTLKEKEESWGKSASIQGKLDVVWKEFLLSCWCRWSYQYLPKKMSGWQVFSVLFLICHEKNLKMKDVLWRWMSFIER